MLNPLSFKSYYVPYFGVSSVQNNKQNPESNFANIVYNNQSQELMQKKILLKVSVVLRVDTN